MKAVIFDSGPLINLSMNGFIHMLERLKSAFDDPFIITEAVKYEVIDRPLNVGRFELGALRIQTLLNHGVLQLPSSLGISDITIRDATKEFLSKANHSLQVHDKWVEIVSEAEMSCLALGRLLAEKKIETMIAVDERTTRVLCEDPRALAQLMSERLHQRASIGASDLSLFKNFKFIRSSELVYVAYKKGILGLEGKKALEAALYATKIKGSAISYDELETLKKL